MRRLFWMGVGAVAGASGTIWAEHKVRERVGALAPDHLVLTAAGRARGLASTVADAVAEGRGAMRDREAQLHHTLRTTDAAGVPRPPVRPGTTTRRSPERRGPARAARPVPPARHRR